MRKILTCLAITGAVAGSWVMGYIAGKHNSDSEMDKLKSYLDGIGDGIRISDYEKQNLKIKKEDES